LLGIEIDM